MTAPIPHRPRPSLTLRSSAAAVLALALFSAMVSADDLEQAELAGTWRCTGAGGEVSFESLWSLDTSGKYSDESRVLTREDVDRDSRPDDLVIESTERGEWSLNAEGRLQFHVIEIELRGLSVDGETVPLDQAASMMEVLTSGAVGRVMMVGIESLSDDRLVATVSGIETTCVR